MKIKWEITLNIFQSFEDIEDFAIEVIQNLQYVTFFCFTQGFFR